MPRVPAFAVLACVTCLASGCATIDYVGESYPPTSHVDLYFSESAVTKPYGVIGKVRASGDQFVTASELHRKMMLRAQQKGADAVIILDISRRPLLDEKDIVEKTTVSPVDNSRTTEKTVSNPTAYGNAIQAIFIKYR